MKPYKQVNVYRWNSDTNKQLYVFNNESKVISDAIYINDMTIYDDDTIENAINKIALSIQKIEKSSVLPVYAWNKDGSILFNIKNIKWNGYNINPFKSNDRSNNKIKDNVSYDYKYNDLFDFIKINIIFSNDINELKNNQYYFVQNKVQTYKYYKKIDTELNELRLVDTSFISKKNIKYHRADLQYKLKKIDPLSIIFDNLHTNKSILFIQWVNDMSKIMYKLYKKHNLPKEILLNWSNLDKIPKIQTIYLYSILTTVGTYCKIMLDQEGLLLYSYIIDLRQRINWDEIVNNRNTTKKILESTLKQKIKLNETSLKLNVYYEIDNTRIDLISKNISKFINIFHVNKSKDPNKIMCVYKRSSNYNKDNIDISDYIKSRFNSNLSGVEIISELVNMGYTNNDAADLVKFEFNLLNDINVENIERKGKKEISNTGTIITIEATSNRGFSIDIINIPNDNELKRLLYWLEKIISLSRDTTKKLKKISPKKDKSPKKDSSPKEETPPREETPPKNDLGVQDYDLDDFEIDGGALGKDYHSYFVNMLQTADKKLFGENYARTKCQAGKQPIVLTYDEIKKLKEEGNFHFENSVEYGSSSDIQNYYACPKLWCPQSKVPLDVNDKNAKCPLENEEPLNESWDGDLKIPRYVRLKKPNKEGICVPCCFRTPPKDDDFKKCKNTKESNSAKESVAKESVAKESNSAKESVAKESVAKESVAKESVAKESPEIIREENYLVTHPAPIDKGRYGIIPESLHNLLFPNVSMAFCSKTLNKSQKCLVRRGINHRISNNKEDSLLQAISYLLNFENKYMLMKDIRKKLDLITFISLENGNICKSFMSKKGLIPSNNKKKIKQLNQYLNTNKKIRSLLSLNNKSKGSTYKLSRLLNIFTAYKKFLDYLSSNDYPIEKTPYYLYSIMKSLYSVLLIIWDKVEKNNNDIDMHCPYYSTFQDILAGMEYNPNVLMLLKDNKHYEPLELKIRSENSEKLLKLNNYPNIKKIIHECNELNKLRNNSNIIYNILNSYENWTRTRILKNPNKFFIDTILINSDLSIDRYLTSGNILLITEKMNINFLPDLIKQLNIKKVLFYDDVVSNKYNINVLTSDLEKFSEKCSELNIKFSFGKINENIPPNSNEYYTRLIIEPRKLINDNIINTRIEDIYYNNKNEKYKKWYQLQQYIAKVLLTDYSDTDLKEISKISKKEKVEILMKKFKNITKEKNKLQIILEEIPIKSKNDIKKWINNLLLYSKYDYYNNNILDDKKEFIYSHNAIVNGIPSDLLYYHESKPNNNIKEVSYKDYEISESKTENKLPKIFEGSLELLPTKWIQHKKMKWVDMVIIKNTNYNNETIPDFFNWFSNMIGINISYNEVKKLRNIGLRNIINDDNLMIEVLKDDISFFNEWSKKAKKKFKTVKIFLDTYYTKISKEQKYKILNEIILSDNLYPNDLDMISISELLNISILIIHKTKHGTAAKLKNKVDDIEEDDIYKRGQLSDQILSSTFYNASKYMDNRPLLIFNKTNDKEKSIYNLVVEKADKLSINSLIMQYKDASNSIKILINALLNK